MPNFDIYLKENPVIGDEYLELLTDLFTDWDHTHTDWDGNYYGEGTISRAKRVSTNWMRNFFQANVGKRLAVASGGIEFWEGQIVRQELLEGKSALIRSMENLTNAVKVVFTKIGDNRIANPSVESSAWGQQGTPLTFTRTTDWASRGDYSMHIIGENLEGALIEDGSVTGLDVAEGVSYTLSVTVNIVSGTWRLAVHESAGPIIARFQTSETGRQKLEVTVPDSNEYEGEIDIQLVYRGLGSGECYADMATFRVASVQGETEWYTDDISIETYGRIEQVMLEGEMSDDEAIGLAELTLAENAWVRTTGPGSGEAFRMDLGAHKLTITCMGLNWTLGWKIIEEDVGTGDADDLMSTVLGHSQFIDPDDAYIDENTAEVQLFIDDPTTLYEATEKILSVGDGTGGAWKGGTEPGAHYLFEARPTYNAYLITDGELYGIDGSTLDPLIIKPGWALNLDLPYVLEDAGAELIDDPRRVWLEEIRFQYKVDSRGREKVTVRWSEEQPGDYVE